MYYRKRKSRYVLETQENPKKIILEQVEKPELFSDSDTTEFLRCTKDCSITEVNILNPYSYVLYYKDASGLKFSKVWVANALKNVVSDLYAEGKLLVPMKVKTSFIKYANGYYLNKSN